MRHAKRITTVAARRQNAVALEFTGMTVIPVTLAGKTGHAKFATRMIAAKFMRHANRISTVATRGQNAIARRMIIAIMFARSPGDANVQMTNETKLCHALK